MKVTYFVAYLTIYNVIPEETKPKIMIPGWEVLTLCHEVRTEKDVHDLEMAIIDIVQPQTSDVMSTSIKLTGFHIINREPTPLSA